MVIGANWIGYNNIKVNSNTLDPLQYKMVIGADWISYNTKYKVLAIGADVHIGYNRI